MGKKRHVFFVNNYGMRTKTLLLLLTCTLLTLAEEVHLKGRVTDKNGEGVSLCLVRIEGQAAGTTANLKGEYSFSFQSADSVWVVYSMMGFGNRRRLLVKPKGNLTLNIQMLPLEGDLAEVTVRETQKQMGQTERIDITDIKRMPSVTGNAIEEIIQTQAGVSTHNELSSQYNVRGGSFDENCVYINGVEVYRPLLIHSGEQEGLSVINPDMVERVDFSAGGFEARYGDKMSSVLDITYKKPTGWVGNGQISVLGASAYFGYGNKRFTVQNGFRYKTSKYLLGSLDTKGEYSPRFIDYQMYLTWKLSEAWEVGIIGYVSDNKYRFTPEDRETKFGTMYEAHDFKVYFDGHEDDLFRTLYGTLQIKRRTGERSWLTTSFSAFHTKERETYDIQGQYWLDNTLQQTQLDVATYMTHARNLLTSNQQVIRTDWEQKGKKHHIRAGLLWRHEAVDENSREWEYRDSAGYSMPHSNDRLNVIYNLKSVNSISSNLMEMYAQDTWRNEGDLGVLSVNYGVRLSYWSWNKEWLCSPRVALGYTPSGNDRMTFRLATGLYYQRPFYKELRDTVTTASGTEVHLNRDIKSQRSIHVVAGWEYRFKLGERPFKFTAEAYYKNQANLNPYNVDNLKIVYYGRNVADGYVVGADFKLYGEMVPGSDSWISFGLMKASMTINGNTIPQPTDQRWNVNMFFSDYFPHSTRWKLSLKACFAGGLPYGAPHTGLEKHVFRSTAYKRVDVGMNFRALNNEDRHLRRCNAIKNIWIGVDCFNIFGFNNVSGYFWVTDTQGYQYAVPNYLTERRINGRILIEF